MMRGATPTMITRSVSWRAAASGRGGHQQAGKVTSNRARSSAGGGIIRNCAVAPTTAAAALTLLRCCMQWGDAHTHTHTHTEPTRRLFRHAPMHAHGPSFIQCTSSTARPLHDRLCLTSCTGHPHTGFTAPHPLLLLPLLLRCAHCLRRRRRGGARHRLSRRDGLLALNGRLACHGLCSQAGRQHQQGEQPARCRAGGHAAAPAGMRQHLQGHAAAPAADSLRAMATSRAMACACRLAAAPAAAPAG